MREDVSLRYVFPFSYIDILALELVVEENA